MSHAKAISSAAVPAGASATAAAVSGAVATPTPGCTTADVARRAAHGLVTTDSAAVHGWTEIWQSVETARAVTAREWQASR